MKDRSFSRRRGTLPAALSLLFALVSWPCAGAVVYVDVDAPGPVHNGQTWATAYLSIQQGVDAAAASDTVRVAAGVYHEAFTLRVGVTVLGNHTATNTSDPSERRWEEEYASVVDGGGAPLVVTLAPETPPSSAATALDGFTVRNGGAGIGMPSSYLSGSSVTISRCRVSGMTGDGIHLTAAAGHPVVASCLIVGCGGAGIYTDGMAPVLVNNTVAGCAGAGLWALWGGTLTNNIVAYNALGFRLPEIPQPTLSHNDAWGNGTDYPEGYPLAGAGNISANPLFVDRLRGDYRLQYGSPCFDTGDDAAPAVTDTDLYGKPRTLNLHRDVGADEAIGFRVARPPHTLYVRPDGNDANDGLSWATATRTIHGALAWLTPYQPTFATNHDVIRIGSGVYAEDVTLMYGVTLAGGYLGQGPNPDQRSPELYPSTIRSDQPVTTPESAKTRDIELGYFTAGLDGMRIEAPGVSLAGPGPCGEDDRPGVTVKDCAILGNLSWVNEQVAVSGNTITGSVQASDPGFNSTITGNVIQGGMDLLSSDVGLLVKDNTITSGPLLVRGLGGTMEHNTVASGALRHEGYGGVLRNTVIGGGMAIPHADIVAGNAVVGGGITVDCPSVVNNTVILCDGPGITTVPSGLLANNLVAFSAGGIRFQPAGSGATVKNNNVYATPDYRYFGTGDRTGVNGNISSDPQLVDRPHGDIHIQPTSPCRDAGDDTAGALLSLDLDGQARLQGAHVDIGADESAGAWLSRPDLVLHVKPDGDDYADGLTWATALRSIDAAQDRIVPTGSNHDEVWVAAGTYYHESPLKNGVGLYGGFAGTETARDPREWRAHETVMHRSGVALTIPPGPLPAGIGQFEATVNGFTIRRGTVDIETNGMWPASVTLADNILEQGVTSWFARMTITGNTILGNVVHRSEGSPGGEQTVAGNDIAGSVDLDIRSAQAFVTHNTMYNGNIIVVGDGNGTITGNRLEMGNVTMNMNIAGFLSGNHILRGSIIAQSGTYVRNNIVDGGSITVGEVPMVAGNTIVGSDGACLIVSRATTAVVNNIVAFGEVGISASGGVPYMAYNCVYGSRSQNYLGMADVTGTQGNISVDPVFVSRADYDLHLAPGSPCRHAGDNSVVLMNEKDFDGDPRIVNGRVDIGADETTIALKYGDVDGDGAANVADVARLLRMASGIIPADQGALAAVSTGDGVITLSDAAHIARHLTGLEPAPF